MYDSPIREPLVTGKKDYAKVTEDICRPIHSKPSKEWLLGFMLSAGIAGLFVIAVVYTFFTGIGAWGLNKTIGWAFDITNFVFWIGIG
ncbi:MAG: hydrogenase, partial [Sphingobacteriia bacterium]